MRKRHASISVTRARSWQRSLCAEPVLQLGAGEGIDGQVDTWQFGVRCAQAYGACPGAARGRYAGVGILKNNTIARVYTQPSGGDQINLWIGLRLVHLVPI